MLLYDYMTGIVRQGTKSGYTLINKEKHIDLQVALAQDLYEDAR